VAVKRWVVSRWLAFVAAIAVASVLLAVSSLGVVGAAHASQHGRLPYPQFSSQIEPFPTLVSQSTCSPTPKPGTVAFRNMILKAFPSTHDLGITRGCSIGPPSEHKEGRAWDWANNAFSKTARSRVAEVLSWLFRTDQYGNRYAMARRLGIMYIIWNRRIFDVFNVAAGWQPYYGPSPHTNHVHFSFTWAGAEKKTSFWTHHVAGQRRPTACRVVDVTRNTHRTSLQAAVNQARAGDVLRVRGTCTGSTTIDRNLTIRGVQTSRSGRPILQGNGGRVLDVRPGVVATLVRLTIRRGTARNEDGGGIRNAGNLTLVNVVVRNNHAQSGGGVDNTGRLRLAGATAIEGNHAKTDGGGVYVKSGALTMSAGSSIRNNTAAQAGGGVDGRCGVSLHGVVAAGDVVNNHPTNVSLACP
jgi:hypothetical protein